MSNTPTQPTPQPAGDAAVAQACAVLANRIKAYAGPQPQARLMNVPAHMLHQWSEDVHALATLAAETARAIHVGNPSVDDRLKDLTIEQLRTRLGHCENALAERDAALGAIQAGKGEWVDWDAQAYATMRDELESWKQRALTAEATTARLCAEFNAENGPTHMGEPVLPVGAGVRDLCGDEK